MKFWIQTKHQFVRLILKGLIFVGLLSEVIIFAGLIFKCLLLMPDFSFRQPPKQEIFAFLFYV